MLNNFSSTKEMLWVEKYRPKTIEDMVLSDTLKKKVQFWLSNPVNNLPNLILLGPPGSGKTTLATVLVNHLIGDSSDYLYINGSAERGLQTIKDSVLEFMRYEPTGLSPIKLLFIDEADNLTPDAFKALRSSMEMYQAHVRIIMTGNFDVFPEAIQSRCTVLRFEAMPFDFAVQRVEDILRSEGIGFNNGDVKSLVSKFYPDLRKTINYAQLVSSQYKVLDLSVLEEVLDEKDLFISLIWDIIDPETKLSKVQVDALKIKLIEFMKKLNVGTQLCLNTLQQLDRKVDSLLDKKEFLDYAVQLKIIISRCSVLVRQSPLPEGILLEFVTRASMLRNIYVKQ